MKTPKLKRLSQTQISQLILLLRRELGLTQEEFANNLGVVFSTINRWEKERTYPSSMALKLIEEKLAKMGKRGQNLLKEIETNE